MLKIDVTRLASATHITKTLLIRNPIKRTPSVWFHKQWSCINGNQISNS